MMKLILIVALIACASCVASYDIVAVTYGEPVLCNGTVTKNSAASAQTIGTCFDASGFTAVAGLTGKWTGDFAGTFSLLIYSNPTTVAAPNCTTLVSTAFVGISGSCYNSPQGATFNGTKITATVNTGSSASSMAVMAAFVVMAISALLF